LEDVLRLGERSTQGTDAGLIVFTYLNPLLRFGMERFCTEAARAGVDGALVTDLTVEEAGEHRRMMEAHNLDTIFWLPRPVLTSDSRRSPRRAKVCVRGFTHWNYRDAKTAGD